MCERKGLSPTLVRTLPSCRAHRGRGWSETCNYPINNLITVEVNAPKEPIGSPYVSNTGAWPGAEHMKVEEETKGGGRELQYKGPSSGKNAGIEAWGAWSTQNLGEAGVR